MATSSEESQPPTPEPRLPIVLHDSGDAILLIGPEEDQQTVTVSRAVMSLASPVWKAMFDRHTWAESSATEIPFPGDDIDSMMILLRIAHLRFNEIPGKGELSFEDLEHLAILCDKYDMVKTVRPFLDLHCWADAYFPDVLAETNCNPSWLFIAWTFGYTESFNALAEHLVLHIGTDERNEPNIKGQYNVLPDTLPPNTVERLYEKSSNLRTSRNHRPESILQIRQETISAMARASYDILDELIAGRVCSVNYAFINTHPFVQACRYMIIGSYIEWLVKNGLYPNRPTGTDLHMSIKEFQQKLASLNVKSFPAVAQSPAVLSFVSPNPHTKCITVVNLAERVDRIISEMATITLETHQRHLLVRREETTPYQD